MARRVVLSVLVFLTGITVVSWGLSYTYLSYNSPSYIWRLFNGAVSCQERASATPRTVFTWHGYSVARKYASSLGIMEEVLPAVRGATYRKYILPLWIPTVVFGGLTFYVYAPIRRRRRWERESRCVECGYNLIGNTSGNCPECGAAIQQVNVASNQSADN